MFSKYVQKIARRIVILVDRLVNYRWFNFPFGRKPMAKRELYEKLALEAAQIKYPEIDEYEHEKGFVIDSEWLHNLALHTQVVIKKSELCYQHGRLIYTTVRDYIHKNHPKYINIIETGTARGFSALSIAKALADADIEEKIITFDLLPHDVAMYWNCIDDLEGPKTRAELLGNYSELINRYLVFCQGDTRIILPKIQISKIHFAFLDGAHTYNYVIHEFECIKDKQERGDIIFFDDYTFDLFPGVVKAVNEICRVHKYSKRVISASKNRGYVIATKK